jgi:hypothetical protein
LSRQKNRELPTCKQWRVAALSPLQFVFKRFVGAISLLVLAVLQNYIAAEGIAIRWEREKVYPIYFECLVRATEGVGGAYF